VSHNRSTGETPGSFANDSRHLRSTAMTKPSPQTLQLNETDTLGPVTIDAAKFEIFEDELDQRLNKLVEAWKHLASPNAQRIRRTSMPGTDKVA
jgi:hypothetical protein